MSTSLIKISVIITTYNSSDTLQRLINSILNQEGLNKKFNIEMVIIDDCSIDDTVKIIKENGLNYISTGTNSGGPNKGRNIGLRIATGDFICITDHDDEWHNDRLVSLLPYLDKTLIITSGFTIFDQVVGKKIEKINHLYRNQPYLFFNKNDTFLSKLTRSHTGQNTYLGSILYSKELKHITFEETFGMLDYDWLLKLFYQQSSIEIPKSLYIRHVNNTNLSLNENYRLKDHHYSIQFVKTYSQDYPYEVKVSIDRINGSLARYYYLLGRMKEARKFFLKSDLGLKTILYYITSFAGHNFVKRKFNIFG